MSILSKTDLKQIEQQLRVHREALQTHLHGARRATGNDAYSDITGTVHSLSDESFAELLTALSNASLGREAEALQETDEALQRLRSNSYGYCFDCGQAIERKRLLAYPIAKRCLQCQREHENKHSEKDSTPSL